MMKWNKLISELKRRHVFKSTIAYLAISWVVLQIASTMLPTFDAPDYVLQGLIVILSIGLIFWIGFSWYYDLTAEGIQKTDDLEPSPESSKLTNRRLNRVIAGSLVTGVLLLLVISFWAGSNWNEDSSLTETRKVAVLPFANATMYEKEAYFETGMTQALIDQLSKIDRLTVINQKSTKKLTSGFDNANSLILNVVKGIDYFVQGSIERDLNMINAHIVLREKINAEPIWQKNYSKDISEIRVLWATVATDLASHMGIIVKPEDPLLWSGLRPVNPEAYELYLKGKHYLNLSSPEEWQRGLVYLQEAIDKNPADPYPYAWMAEAYITLCHGPQSSPDLLPKALASARRSIELDSTVALGWAALSHYHTYFGRDWAMAEDAFNRANTLNPNLANNHYHRAWYLTLFGRMNEAIEEHKLAQELDPFTPGHSAWLGSLYSSIGMYEEGIKQTENASLMEDDLNYALGMYVRGFIFINQGQVEEGLELLRLSSEINPEWKYTGYGLALLSNGYTKEGRAILRELESKPPSDFNASCIGGMYAILGEYDKSFEAWNYGKRAAWFPWIIKGFTNHDIGKDPRFLQLLRDMNLPDPAPLEYDPVLEQ